MSRQGSASFTIAIGSLTALVAGAMILTLFFYPVAGAMMDAAFWEADTAQGATLITYVDAALVFTGGIMLIALLAYIWVSTRQ